MKKKFVGIVLAMCMLCVFVPWVRAATIVDSGECGDNLTWTFDSDGTLIISGTGDMMDRAHDQWSSFRHNIKQVIIEDGVTSISNNAFEELENLTYAYIADTVENIGIAAFELCKNLLEVNIPNGITEISNYLFYDCYKLEHVNIPLGVTVIGEEAFSSCQSLTGIAIPDSVEVISDKAFYDCENIKSIVLPDSVTYIGGRAFMYCSSLTNVTMSKNVSEIGSMAFDFCYSLNSITIPKNVGTIYRWTFSDCQNMRSVFLPENISRIEYGAFRRCNNLKDVYYEGTEEQWLSISIDNESDGNQNLIDAKIHFNSSEIPMPKILDATVEYDKDYSLISFDVTLENIYSDCLLVTALYNNRILTDIQTSQLKPDDTGKRINFVGDASQAKIFIWNSLGGMRPLCEVKTADIE